MRRAAVLLVLTLLCAAACSSPTKTVNTTAKVATSTKAPGSLPTTTAPASRTTTEARLPSKADLQAKLLTLRDLPSDWGIKPKDTANGSTSNPDCFNGLDDGVSKATVEADFVEGSGFPLLEESLDVYPKATMGPELDKAVHIIDSCGSFTITSHGLPMSGKITRLPSFPTFGDRSVAWDMELDAQGIVAHAAFVLVAQGTTAMTLMYADVGDGAISAAQTYVSAAVAKL